MPSEPLLPGGRSPRVEAVGKVGECPYQWRVGERAGRQTLFTHPVDGWGDDGPLLGGSFGTFFVVVVDEEQPDEPAGRQFRLRQRRSGIAGGSSLAEAALDQSLFASGAVG